MTKVSLQVKIIVLLAVLIVGGLSCIIYLNGVDQEKSVKEEVRKSSHIIADAVFNGLIYPMAQGDNETVRKELVDLKKHLRGGEIFIFGRDKGATFASEQSKVGTDLLKEIKSTELTQAVGELLQTGKTSERVYEEWIGGKPYLTLVQPILNEGKCQQCHPGNEAVLGGMMMRQSLETMYASIRQQKYKSFLVGLVGCLFTLIVIYFVIAKLVTQPLKRVIGELTQNADQVLASADLVASASQTLAEGATEQAAGIEETSASLEEMSSMTMKNAENAGQADRLLQEANSAVARANKDMAGLTHSMAEISRASEETSKIIKTIDEIAFQTNLLALNAAVEAARAGEAGAGFAIVANEVRNLALRAAEAAKNTAVLIEGTVHKVREGSELVTRTNGDFLEVATLTEQSCSLVAEIVEASREQAQGIEQISRAVVEIEKVVQENAAGAEESAAASQELNQLADGMSGVVTALASLVGGNGSTNAKYMHMSVLPPARQNLYVVPREGEGDGEFAAEDQAAGGKAHYLGR